MNAKEIETPTREQVLFYLKEWDKQTNYVLKESNLTKLFQTACPENTEIDNVLIKVCSLSDFYGTNIFSPFSVAKHIVDLNIDERLQNGDTSLVDDIAKITINGKINYFYSFASKYCSRHLPTEYPIYDYYAETVLSHFLEKDNFYPFQKDDLKNYPTFKEIVIQFRKYYRLEEFDLKQIDKYLWQLDKEYFPKQ